MKFNKKRISRHLLFWVTFWVIQSLLFSGGSEVSFYLVKNIAIVSLQALVVYLNWGIFIQWLNSRLFILFISASLLIIYLAYAISFNIIDILSTLIFPDMVTITIGRETNWWPTGFWRILSGSAPYSIALLLSTVAFLFNANKKQKKELEVIKSNEGTRNDLVDKNILTIKDGKTIHRIKKEDILYVQGLREYVNWYMTEEKLITLHSLQKLETLLADEGFLRIHKSYLVNTSFVNTVRHNALEVSGEKIPIGRSYREKVKNYFEPEF